MKKIKDEYRNLFMYGGLTKEEYVSIEEQRIRENFKTFKVVAMIANVYFCLLFVSTFFSNAVSANRTIDLIMALIALLVFYTLKDTEETNLSVGTTVIYILVCSIFAFAIIIGAIISKEYLSVTFPALLIAVPLFYIDRPYRVGIISVSSTLIFIIICAFNKSGATRNMDIYNALCFCALSLFISLYASKTKMKATLLMYRVEGLSMADELTGFLNRRSFEEHCKELAKSEIASDLVIVSMDANGLKGINDSLGHEAGDEMICAAAECMKNCFGGYGRIYRTGGDEFMAILNIDLDRFELLLKNFESSSARWDGKLIKGISISSGYCSKSEFEHITVEEMRKISDKRMYEAKALYYSKKGVDRRGQQDAFNALCASYVKILKVNLTDDTYKIVSVRPEMEVAERNYNKDSISQYLRDVALAGTVHPDDMDKFISKTTIKYMRDYFHENSEPLSIFYKRLINGEYCQSIMQIIPANDYSDNAQNTFLYVKDLRISNRD